MIIELKDNEIISQEPDFDTTKDKNGIEYNANEYFLENYERNDLIVGQYYTFKEPFGNYTYEIVDKLDDTTYILYLY